MHQQQTGHGTLLENGYDNTDKFTDKLKNDEMKNQHRQHRPYRQHLDQFGGNAIMMDVLQHLLMNIY